MMYPCKIGTKSSNGLPYIILQGVLGIIYPTIKGIGSFKAQTYYSRLKKLQIDEQLYSSVKMVLILLESKCFAILNHSFRGHSPHAGGTTFYASLGLSEDIIQALGRWSSKA